MGQYHRPVCIEAEEGLNPAGMDSGLKEGEQGFNRPSTPAAIPGEPQSGNSRPTPASRCWRGLLRRSISAPGEDSNAHPTTEPSNPIHPSPRLQQYRPENDLRDQVRSQILA